MRIERISSVQLLILVVGLIGVAMAAGKWLVTPHNRLAGRGGAALPMKSLEGAVLQLELARDEEDIRQILLAGDWRRNVRDARAGNRADGWYFIPAYTVALIASGLLVTRGNAGVWFWVFAGAAVAIAAFDYRENAGIERTLRHIEESGKPLAGDAAAIAVPSKVKWVLLALVLLGQGVFAATSGDAVVRWFSVAPLLFAGLLGLVLARYFQEIAAS
jgi:hypothetical protein